jgi:hypothetical protein
MHVTPGFLIVAVVSGLALQGIGVVVSIIVFGATLFVHELARAILAWRLGRSCTICIDGTGGDTELSGAPFKGAAGVLFALVGSCANLFVAGLALLVLRRGVDAGAAPVFRLVFLSQGVWGSVQLLPLVPFRIGQIIAAREAPILRAIQAIWSAVILFGLGVRVVERGYGAVFALVIFAFAASVRTLGRTSRELLEVRAGMDHVGRQVDLALAEGRPKEAASLATLALAQVRSHRRREALLKALAWAGIGQADPFLAHSALLQLRPGAIDVHLLTSYLACCNRVEEAIELLEEARFSDYATPESTRLLVDLHFRMGDRAAVLALARSEDTSLSVEDRRAIESAVASAHPA